MSGETAEVSTSSESVSRAPWLLPVWLEKRRDTMKAIFAEEPEESKRARMHTAFDSYFDEDLEYCASPQFNRGETDTENSKNFYEFFLKMLRHIPDKKANATFLSKCFLQDYIQWVEREGIEDTLRQKYLNPEIKELAVRVAFKRPQLVDYLDRVFGVSLDNQIELAKEAIVEFQKEEKHKEVANLVIKYRLVDDYTFETLVLPMIIADKMQVVMEVLAESTKMQKAYLRFMDNFIQKSDEYVERFFAPFKDTVKVTTDRFKSKNAYTGIQRFFNGPVKQFKFDLAEADAPNYDFYGKRKALRFFATLKFEELKLTDETYFQNVHLLLRRNGVELFTAFLEDLWASPKREARIDAISWMILFDVSEFSDCVPAVIRKFFEYPNQTMVKLAYQVMEMRKKIEFVRDGDQLYAYEPEKKYPIIIVKTLESLEKLFSILVELDRESEKPEIIGYDSEMKQVHFKVKNSMTVGLIQLCIRDTVYIIDCVELEKHDNREELFKRLVDVLIFPENLQLIGFDMYNDIEHLFATSFLTYKLEDVKNTLCMKQLVEAITEHDEKILEIGKKTCKLNDITEKLLGRKLDKTEQHSNWEARPIRKKQLIYAAIDAVVVYELFGKILEMAKNGGMDEATLQKASNLSNRAKKAEKKIEDKKAEKTPVGEMFEILTAHRDPSKPLIRPSDLRVVIDLMLGGLANSLRKMEVDVCQPKSNAEMNKVLEENKRVEEAEKRFIVTTVNKHTEQRLAEHGDRMIVLNVAPEQSKLSFLLEFLDHFNLDIRAEDEFNPISSKSNESVLSSG